MPNWMNTYIDQDDSDSERRSPKLVPVKPKLSPTLSRPDFVNQFIAAQKEAANQSDSSSADDLKPPKRLRQLPSRSEEVLLSYLDPNRPDIARDALRRPLCSASQSEASDSDNEMMGDGTTAVVALRTTAPSAFRTKSLIDQAQAGLAATTDYNRAAAYQPYHPTSSHVPQPLEPSPLVTTATATATAPLEPDGEMSLAAELLRLKRQPAKQSKPNDSMAASSLAPLLLTPSQAPSPEKLPALDRGHSHSTSGLSAPRPPTLPPLRPLLEVTTGDTPKAPANPHRPRGASISSLGSAPARSPTMLAKQALSSSSSPAAYHQLQQQQQQQQHHRPSHLSPRSSRDEHSPANFFDYISPSSTGRNSMLSQNRRRRATSDAPPLNPSSLALTASSGSCDSTSSSSSSGLDSVGGSSVTSVARSGEFSPPLFSAQQSTSSLSSGPDSGSTGLYRCKHEGCNAPPFQTQYLLNSHANVHSSNRPHYCPVPGCSRGEGGRGFKRKNEMIRHGLVHDSPGYVCPFCPDREHRYPRPDNLQRHVRMHHKAIGRDDARLQEVLAQRPQGAGIRGGRRRRTTIPA